MNLLTLGRIFVRAILAGTTASVAAGCYDSHFGLPKPSDEVVTVSETLAGVRRLYAGRPFVVEADIVASGIVTSSDQAGNFYRTLCIEQDRCAVEIMAGIDGLHNDYPPGCRVTIRLKGLTMAESRGVLQLGTEPEPGSGFDTDYIGSRAALDRVLSRNSEVVTAPQPALMNIADLTTDRCGSLVRIAGLRYQPGNTEDLTERITWSGYRRFEDRNGLTIDTYVRSYASFAEMELPTQWVTLTGILQYDDSAEGRFLLKLRDENDCFRMD